MKQHKEQTRRQMSIDLQQATKSRERTFRLDIRVPGYFNLVEEVLDSIENDTLSVYRPDDEDAFGYHVDEDGAHNPLARATLPISIREWLCVGCQFIECGNSENSDRLAHYASNLHESICPVDDSAPFGPAAFTGKIVLCHDSLPKNNSAAHRDRFKFIIAHELVHVFDTMRYVVPACMNWKQFWEKALDDGGSCDLAWNRFKDQTDFLDQYGSDFEKEAVAEFWPSKAEEWFCACEKIGR